MREGRNERAAKKGRDLLMWGHKRSQSAPVLQNLAGSQPRRSITSFARRNNLQDLRFKHEKKRNERHRSLLE